MPESPANRKLHRLWYQLTDCPRFDQNARLQTSSSARVSILLTIHSMKSWTSFVLVASLTFLVAVGPASAADSVEFTIAGRAQFSVPAEWSRLPAQSTSGSTILAFEIPNLAEKGTAPFSFLSITAEDSKSVKDHAAFEKLTPSGSPNAVEKHLVEGWRCSTSSSMQPSTQTTQIEYVVWDCRRMIADSVISVRIGWPKLPENLSDYDKRMEAVLSSFLTSVSPFKGVPKSGVLGRQEN